MLALVGDAFTHRSLLDAGVDVGRRCRRQVALSGLIGLGLVGLAYTFRHPALAGVGTPLEE